jgi:hypothetical protein
LAELQESIFLEKVSNKLDICGGVEKLKVIALVHNLVFGFVHVSKVGLKIEVIRFMSYDRPL